MESYGLAAAMQESLWKSYVGDVVVIVVEQAWYMYGYVMFVTLL